MVLESLSYESIYIGKRSCVSTAVAFNHSLIR